jgi:hypothetical protein
MKSVSKRMQARINALVEERLEEKRTLYLNSCDRPLKKYTIKIKGEEPVEVMAHLYNQVLDNQWVRLYVNQENGSTMVFACMSDEVQWMKGDTVG